MRSASTFAVGFLSGALLALFATSHVWIAAARFSGEGAHVQYLLEPELLASRAARNGDGLRQVVHSLNVADAQAGIGFRWKRLLEAQYRAKAALALERFGRPDLAESQWTAVTDLDPRHSVDWHREFARMTGHHSEEEERAHLDSRTGADFVRALLESREP